jgi:hypothetical protein
VVGKSFIDFLRDVDLSLFFLEVLFYSYCLLLLFKPRDEVRVAIYLDELDLLSKYF